MFPYTPIPDSDVAAFQAQGFELSVHVDTGCADWSSREQLDAMYSSQIAELRANLPSIAAPRTHRTHCVVWSDFETQPLVELAHGIRLDTTYYYWPGSWVQDRPGFMTGSGMPMRYADRTGRAIDVYQAATQMTDESDQTYPDTINALLDGALSSGFYGVFTANMHTDTPDSPGADDIVASAQARGVPVVSASQVLDWVDGRNASSFGGISFSGSTLSFTIAADAKARNIYAMLPRSGPTGTLTALTVNGSPVTITSGMIQTIKGMSYVLFPAVNGSYAATYGP
jgi:hypothetical protein